MEVPEPVDVDELVDEEVDEDDEEESDEEDVVEFESEVVDPESLVDDAAGAWESFELPLPERESLR
ncbi:hypothetical protein [Prauserella halophila]|uniref:hypothetical protein n=1 Tax=Prauserella halophila TaxID=185641 RepID=UPI0027E37673|nr:hypothetical protein [Prauserella halophila]